MCQVALWIQIDQECPDSHLGETKTIRGRDRALPCPPFEVEEELFSDGFEGGRKAQVAPVPADILWLIIALLTGIPLWGRKDSLRLFLKEVVF